MSRTKSESVRVIARFRPSNKREAKEWNKYSDSKWQNEIEEPCSCSGQTIKIENPSTGRPYRFTYDDVLWQESTQEETFQTVAAPVCRNALNGFNGTVFAYGQTGSGKTHTMIGPEKKYSAKDSGIIPRAANFFFHAIENSPDVETAELKVSFLEVYKGSLRDLNPANKSYPDLKIRQRMNNETFVENLNETQVTSLGQVLKLIQIANSHRTMAATSMNKTSSRSHFIITFYLKLKKTAQAGGHKLSAKVNFIDLAGSEKVKKTGASGQRLKEAQSINAGLSTLSRVIEALVKKRQSIPFRDSVLTWILKDSLAGNTKTTIVITNTPHQFNKDETITTCRFGSRCKLIKTKVTSNKELTPQQMKALIKRLQKENTDLRDNLDLGGGGGNTDEIQSNYKQKVDELRSQIERLKNRNDDEKEEDEFEQERAEFEEKIERLEAEVDNLKTELEITEQEKRNLAVMNALMAEKLDKSIDELQNEQAIADLARGDLEYLKGEENGLINQLKEDLRFEDEEAQEIYDSVFAEINKIAEELEDRDKDLEELEEKLEANETELEQKNYEISKITNKLENAERNGGKKKKKKGGDDEDEAKYDDDVVAMNITLNLNDQEEYLQDLADKEQELWEEREERAWRKYLNQRAKDEGYKKGKDLLKARRNEAKQQVKDGIIPDVPEDEELLEDIRDDFYRLYDPATGQIRDEDELDDEYGNQEYLDEVADEQAVDDPFEWSEEEVADWLKQEGLKKYAKQFKKEGIDGRVLLIDLNKTNLKRDLGVKSVHVDKLMRGIQELRLGSPGYDDWKISQGIVDDEPKGAQYNINKGAQNIDDEFDVDHDPNYNEEEDFELTEEEKQFGEQFWALDELFNILDIHGTGELDRAAFKHGLHALKVELSDDDMDNVFRQICNDDKTEFITYRAFIQYLQFTDFLGAQSQKYAQDILAALPRVAANRRQYVTRAAMVIKYAQKYNNTKTEINNYLQNKGLQRAEIDAAWKQYRFNPKAIRDIDFKSLIGRKGKLIDMAIRDPDNVEPFDDFTLYKLLKRAGFKAFGSKEFNDLDYLRAAGYGARIFSIKCWYDPQSQFFNGLQVIYQCANGEKLKGGRNMVRQGQYVEDEMVFQKNEVLCSITVYFAHFVCGVLFETDKRTRLFGSDLGQSSTTLAAPMGTQIMAFYGSISRLFETIGCYVVVSDGAKGGNRGGNMKSGARKINQNNMKAKIKKHQSQTSVVEEEGDGTTNSTGGKRKKKKKKNRDYDYDDQ
mmetsp:Transcript_25903/g.22643  ORF Transcript_25903/g.22643 Transcript_25903/m.22643 type:complete len:1251 (-) Transcript_25903:273-4025(-)|eukprot:CAMPEP_0201571730 /NCGR_PEP_ID=MMETSP0190_2-20130828/14655_1 /ASSEMBLY_ACC=CAM_ASM_000263 /TAXON_ID=37353 /ORGANISM="Rosalina sp." /LENGTH=1250 /DNA_ID=CAMNT_0047996707 /DNA_START=164 /DNA_END=3916 /DNA_ORIENTATION=-